MQKFLPIVQVLLSIFLIAAILLQQRGTGAGSAFGGEGGTYGARRGWEKTLFIATIIIGILFVGFLAASLVFHP